MAKNTMETLVPPTPETVRRIVEQGTMLLQTFHNEYRKEEFGQATEFWRGNLTGWRQTLLSAYGDSAAESIIMEAAKAANLPIPHCGIRDSNGDFMGWDSLAGFP
jgi:hypothetical protein